MTAQSAAHGRDKRRNDAGSMAAIVDRIRLQAAGKKGGKVAQAAFRARAAHRATAGRGRLRYISVYNFSVIEKLRLRRRGMFENLMAIKPVRVICVDDDPLALNQLEMVMGNIGVAVSCDYFGSPERALAAHRKTPAELVISDLRMGATNGLKLIAAMQEFAPETIYMLLSGDADLQSALKAVNEARVFRFLTKPASVEEIKAGVFEVIRELNLRKMRTIANSTLDAIERMNAAVASVDVDGKLLYANEPAEIIFKDSGYFDIGGDNELRSVDPAETKKFQAFLKSLARADSDAAARSIFRFARAGQPNPVVVSVVFFPGANGQDPHFSLMIFDPTRRNIANVDEIATALNLTPSEARVVHGLIVGGSVEDAAALAGVSVNTARTYLKTVFSKTGVSRQAELVRLALLTAA